MSKNVVVQNTATGLKEVSSVDITSLVSAKDTLTVVSAATQTNFPLTLGTLSSSNALFVFINGVLQTEGGAYSYTRNTGLNRIEFTTPVIKDAVVFIRVYS